MKISEQEVAHVATLARLQLSSRQAEMFTGQLNDILAYMEKMRQLDTAGVPPTSHALELTGALRQDQVRPCLEREKALANTPQNDGESLIVPKVI